MYRTFSADDWRDVMVGKRVVAVDDDEDGTEGLILTFEDGMQLAFAFAAYEGRVEIRWPKPAAPPNET